MSKWQEYSDKFLELSQREKIIISGCGVFLTAYLVFILLIESQVAVLNKSQSALLKHNASLANVRAQIEEVKQALKNDPNDQVKKDIERLKAQLDDVNRKLDKTLVDYVAPKEMAKELTSLLSTSSDVRIIGVTILAPEKIDIDVKDIEQSDALPEYYRHGFEVVVSGEYFNLMNLVKKILSQNNKFSVTNLDYHVTTHPTADMTLSLVTVSDSKNVIRL